MYYYTSFYHNNELLEIYREYFVINSTVHSHSTRQKSDLYICSVQKSIGQKSIQYVGSVLWNEIPPLLKNPMLRYTFKHKLKAHLLNELAVSWILCTVFFITFYSLYCMHIILLHFVLCTCSCTLFVIVFFLCYSIYSICM